MFNLDSLIYRITGAEPPVTYVWETLQEHEVGETLVTRRQGIRLEIGEYSNGLLAVINTDKPVNGRFQNYIYGETQNELIQNVYDETGLWIDFCMECGKPLLSGYVDNGYTFVTCAKCFKKRMNKVYPFGWAVVPIVGQSATTVSFISKDRKGKKTVRKMRYETFNDFGRPKLAVI